jgi:hypothetical protein
VLPIIHQFTLVYKVFEVRENEKGTKFTIKFNIETYSEEKYASGFSFFPFKINLDVNKNGGIMSDLKKFGLAVICVVGVVGYIIFFDDTPKVMSWSEAVSKVSDEVSEKAENFIDEIFNSSSSSSAEVMFVKNGKLQSCPTKTVGQMVEGFMGSPSWVSGETEQGKKFVNIEGSITFRGKPVDSVLQFYVEPDKGTFKFNALEFNEVPQANFITMALLGKMCEDT